MTDCHASDADAPYGCHHVVPSTASLAGVLAREPAGVQAVAGIAGSHGPTNFAKLPISAEKASI